MQRRANMGPNTVETEPTPHPLTLGSHRHNPPSARDENPDKQSCFTPRLITLSGESFLELQTQNGKLFSVRVASITAIEVDCRGRGTVLWVLGTEGLLARHTYEEILGLLSPAPIDSSDVLAGTRLSHRVQNVLARKGITRISQLLEVTRGDLLSFSFFGETSMLDVESFLASRGYTVGQNVPVTKV